MISSLDAVRNERAFLAGALKSAEASLAKARGAEAAAADTLATPQARVAALERAMAGGDANAAAIATEAAKVEKLRGSLVNADARAAELQARRAALEATQAPAGTA